jgi:hypothetical protein
VLKTGAFPPIVGRFEEASGGFGGRRTIAGPAAANSCLNLVVGNGDARCHVKTGKLRRWWSKRGTDLLDVVVIRGNCGENKSKNAEGSK